MFNRGGHSLRIPFFLWCRLVRELRRRGRGQRESGAFLLGYVRNGARVVRSYRCYDDLCPTALDRGYIVFDGAGYGALWAECKQTGYQVLADVHTHPGLDTRQSGIDTQNPMVAEAGHIALIVPCFAAGWCWRTQGVGVHEYLGNYAWRPWPEVGRRSRVRLTLWPWRLGWT